MDKKIVILLLTIVQWSMAQAQFTDNFSDSDFNLNPSWIGDDTKFIIENSQLRLMAPAESSTAYLITNSAAIVKGVWECYVRMDFNPSASNLTRVYLTADQQDLTGNLNGYYVQLGGTDDEVSLYRQTGATRTKIIDGLNGTLNLSASETNVRVTRDETGKWELFSDVGLANSYTKEGEVIDAAHPASTFFGVYCIYTSTRSISFYFDNFVVTGAAYTPPTPAQWKDIILSEIYADPSSSNGLPNAEFVELFNRTNATININGWRLSDPSNGGNLAGVIEPNEYVIITSTSALADFESYGKVIGVSGFPSLNNSGDALTLKDNLGIIIDSVNYTDAWYKDTEKKSGGWSLELIDPQNPCGERENWIASEDPLGGTPAKQNSVFANKPDLTPPVLMAVIPQSSTKLLLTFSEKLKAEIPDLDNFQLVPDLEISSVHFVNNGLTQLELTLNQPLQSTVDCTITVSGIRDCNGNSMDSNSMVFGLPEIASPLEVVINEILFNPRPTGVDFVELYNPTTKYFNLKNWSFANRKDGVITNVRKLIGEDFLLHPKDYIVFTVDPEILISQYSRGVQNKFQRMELPSLPDDEGNIILMDNMNTEIDGFEYTDDLHSIFIKDEEGVSLERIAADSPTQEGANWKSASATVGFSTPGYSNSNSRENSSTNLGEVVVIPEVFIPINGQPDFTEIQYNFDQGGFVANIKIMNSQGVLIKEIANNVTLGTQGFFRWDGDQENGSKARVGYYLVWFQVFDDNANIHTYRKRVVIVTQF